MRISNHADEGSSNDKKWFCKSIKALFENVEGVKNLYIVSQVHVYKDITYNVQDFI